jgi:D-galacturonate reductase
VDLLICGTGEYVTGFVHDAPSSSDKSKGVVALSAFDLRRQGRIGHITLVGTQGGKGPALRGHIRLQIGNYAGLDTSFDLLPGETVARDTRAWKVGLERLKPRQGVWIYTPDDTHFEIARAALEQNQHVLLAKPGVSSVAEGRQLVQLAKERNLLLMIDYHKRWDPLYRDARQRSITLGDFSYFHSYMSQPKSQLETFRSWAGTGSDISYYLNSHHLDFHCWSMTGRARPTSLTAFRSTGVAKGTEDIITLVVEWTNLHSGNQGMGIYTASWIAPTGAEVHSQQRFHYVGHEGDIQVDQAHRGYEMCRDGAGLKSLNPLFFSYTPDEYGRFQGRGTYGYQPFDVFCDLVNRLNDGSLSLDEIESSVPTLESTLTVISLLEAGRRSLASGGKIHIP